VEPKKDIVILQRDCDRNVIKNHKDERQCDGNKLPPRVQSEPMSKPNRAPKEKYDFIDEETEYEKPVVKKYEPGPKKEAMPEKKKAVPLDEGPKPALQQILALFNPELILMNESQWGTYIHKYVTDEYVLIGQTKTMPMYRKRKQLMSDIEKIEKTKGFNMLEFPLVMQYIAWRHDIQMLVHLDKPAKRIVAYPEIHLWRRDIHIYCVGTTSVSELKFKQVIEYVETAEDTGVFMEWPEIDGKKTELLAELGEQASHLKKDELSRLVGKNRVYDLFGR
jgi:hypothetical protein